MPWPKWTGQLWDVSENFPRSEGQTPVREQVFLSSALP